MPKRYPAIYVLNPIGIDGALEATDVLHFCSEECRQAIAENTAHTIKKGESEDWRVEGMEGMEGDKRG